MTAKQIRQRIADQITGAVMDAVGPDLGFQPQLQVEFRFTEKDGTENYFVRRDGGTFPVAAVRYPNGTILCRYAADLNTSADHVAQAINAWRQHNVGHPQAGH